jgi:phosphate:Na+ symporter
MDLGTTLKSVLATLGGSRDARRTAYAHVGYNVVTALFAFVLLGLVPYLQTLTGDPATALTAFHTLFNAGGVVIMLPVLPLFARAIERLVPGTAGDMPEPLDTALLTEPRAALDAARAATDRIAAAMFRDLAARLRGAPADGADAEPALEDVDRFLAALAIPEGTPGPRNRMAALLHRLDHLHRLGNRGGQDDRIALLAHDGLLRRPAAALAAALARAAQTPSDAALARRIDRLNGLIAARTARLRRSFLLREHAGLAAPRDVFDLTDALRWLERSGRHAERIVHYGAVAAEEEPSRADARREDV